MDWFRFERNNLIAFDRKAYPKTFNALVRVVQRLSKSEEALLEMVIVHVLGSIFGSAMSVQGWKEVIFLDPSIERKSQRHAHFAVAHEFAHVVLEHNFRNERYDTSIDWGERSHEKAANRKVEEWGFYNYFPRIHGRQSCMK